MPWFAGKGVEGVAVGVGVEPLPAGGRMVGAVVEVDGEADLVEGGSGAGCGG